MRKMVVTAFVLCLILTSLHYQPVRAADLYVSTTGTDSGDCTGSPCKTITYALSQAFDGDTIYVAAGTYDAALGEVFSEGWFYIDFDLTLIGAGASTTIIDAAGSEGDIFVIQDATFDISGFTLRGAEGEYGRPLWYENDSSGTVENNIITHNRGDGVHVHDISGDGLYIVGNLITHNREEDGEGGSGICLDTDTENPIIITNNTISNNWDDGIDNGEGADPTITNNIITYNGDEGIQWWFDIYYTSLHEEGHSEGDDAAEEADRIRLTKSIVFQNGEYDISHNDVYGNYCDNYMDMDDLTGIDGNISEDPLFTASFHLICESPVIDEGDNEAPGIPDDDLDGEERIQNDIVDMGAYEGCVELEMTIVDFSISDDSICPGDSFDVTLTFSFEGIGLYDVITNEFQLPEGSIAHSYSFTGIGVDGELDDTGNGLDENDYFGDELWIVEDEDSYDDWEGYITIEEEPHLDSYLASPHGRQNIVSDIDTHQTISEAHVLQQSPIVVTQTFTVTTLPSLSPGTYNISTALGYYSEGEEEDEYIFPNQGDSPYYWATDAEDTLVLTIEENCTPRGVLLIGAWDVDNPSLEEPDNPEIDQVYLNGVYLGDLTGSDGNDSITAFTFDLSILGGCNTVAIYIDVGNPGEEWWGAEIDWGELIYEDVDILIEDDNENNGGTHTPDGDMDVTIFNNEENHPVEFNLTPGNCPLAQGGRKAKAVMPSMLPAAQNNIIQGGDLAKQADDLLMQAQEKELDTATCEKLIDEANELLEKAKKNMTNPVYANNLALQAIDKLKDAIECLKALLG